METTIHFKRGETCTYLKHPLQHANLLQVPFPHAKGCHQEIRKILKGFFVGRGKPRKKTPFGKMEGNLSEQRHGWAGKSRFA